MNILAWNCQGLGSSLTSSSLTTLCRKTRPTILFLSETKNMSSLVSQKLSSLYFHNFHLVDPRGLSGGLALAWSSSVSCVILDCAHFFIAVDVTFPQNINVTTIGVYLSCDWHERSQQLDFLSSFCASLSKPFIIFGDFNAILSNNEKISHSSWNASRSIQSFQSFVNQLSLFDFHPRGPFFTWTNKQTEEVQSRLDRFLASPCWMSMFPQGSVRHLDDLGSDHRAIAWFPSVPRDSHRQYFSYDVRWNKNEEVCNIVSSVWNNLHPIGSRMFIVQTKLQEVRRLLIQWARQGKTNSARRIGTLRQNIQELRNSYPVDWNRIRPLERELSSALAQEKIYWQQKSRQKWLLEGDCNTSYFHKVVSTRRSKNHIHTLHDPSGVPQSEESEKQKIATNFYQQLFSSEHPRGFILPPTIPGFPCKVTHSMNERLLAFLSDEEIRRSVFDMGPSQAPGPDGFTAAFFQNFWPIIKKDVCDAVRSFFHSGKLLKETNFTIISLIPKVDQPQNMRQLRPISLCQVFYKIISKILASRLGNILPSIIGAHQSGFVKNRRITDNVIIAHEVMHFLKTKKSGKAGFMALKLDMEKAYDRIEWAFLFKALSQLGFHPHFIHLIHECVTTTSYTVSINGFRHGSIKPTRGLRQGDPLSSLLFAICTEGFAGLINHALHQGTLKGVKIGRSTPVISHLFFADDSFLFLEVNEPTIRCVQDIFRSYQVMSGQKINLSKSAAFFSNNLPRPLASHYASMLGVGSIGVQDKYLGLPSLVPRSKRDMFRFVEDKLLEKLAGWKQSCLSPAGKETLIKTVASALPIYVMSCFRLPTSICRKLNSHLARFWWNGQNQSHPIHWLKWTDLCQSKMTGGLGFRSFDSFNQALLAKQCWHLISNSDSLAARILKGKYFPRTSFLKANLGSRPSWLWRSILHGR
ncbi:LINE-1 retrotransposable element ORF2 protein [Linum perenne]